jgi:hypothetical protein
MSYQRFLALKELWDREIGSSSSTTVICSHPAYKEIIGMGIEAVPYILEDMLSDDAVQYGPRHWFVALYLITGVNPVPNEHRGNMGKMASDWIAWGREKGFLCKESGS